jgi:protein-disulfide isomerase
MKAYFDKHKTDTRFAFIEFPIFGEASQLAAQASTAAHAQGDKFPAFHFAMMTKGAADSSAVLEAARSVGLDIGKLTADLQGPTAQKATLGGFRLAREAKFGGTPMFIINGKVHAGEITEAELKTMLK